MDLIHDSVLLSRLQFAFTALFHMLWPLLTIGLSVFLVITESLWLKTRDVDYYRHTRFWSRLFLLNFGVGVVSGIPLEFQFGTNWSVFSVATGNYFGNILGFEAAMAFMLEAGFLGIMMFGWNRVPPAMHLFATVMVAVGASMSAFWIMVANGWMQTPAGVHMEDGRVIVDSYAQAIFHPSWWTSVSHMWLACLITSVLVIGGISAWYIQQGRQVSFFLKSFRIAAGAAAILVPLQILTGDASGLVVAEHQPAKLAAMEAHWDTNAAGVGAPWSVLAWPDPANERNTWSIEIPTLLSLIVTHDTTGVVRGLRDFAPEDRPPVLIPYYSFRVMLALGFWFLFISLATVFAWRRRLLEPGGTRQARLIFRLWIISGPLGYVASEAGWLTREVGRQPWVVQGLMRTRDAASDLPPETVLWSLLGYVAIYTLLLAVFLVFARRLLIKGPDFTAAPPRLDQAGALSDRSE